MVSRSGGTWQARTFQISWNFWPWSAVPWQDAPPGHSRIQQPCTLAYAGTYHGMVTSPTVRAAARLGWCVFWKINSSQRSWAHGRPLSLANHLPREQSRTSECRKLPMLIPICSAHIRRRGLVPRDFEAFQRMCESACLVVVNWAEDQTMITLLADYRGCDLRNSLPSRKNCGSNPKVAASWLQ